MSPASTAPPTLGSGDLLTPLAAGVASLSLSGGGGKGGGPAYSIINALSIPKTKHELLSRMKGEGLQVDYAFTRRAHVSSNKMLAIEVTFVNMHDSAAFSGVAVGGSRLQSGMRMGECPTVGQLASGASSSVTLGIDFNDTFQPAKFDVW